MLLMLGLSKPHLVGETPYCLDVIHITLVFVLALETTSHLRLDY